MFAQYCSLLLLKNNTFFASFGLLVGCLLPRFDIFFLIEEVGKKLDNCEQLPFISVLRDDVSTEREESTTLRGLLQNRFLRIH